MKHRTLLRSHLAPSAETLNAVIGVLVPLVRSSGTFFANAVCLQVHALA
jgi:hypothetical protein